jgi:CarboxypepD_reg-like domain/Carboxypeptidase regulatory-like domain
MFLKHAILSATLLLISLSAVGKAQTVTGVLVDRTTRNPIAAVMVSLLDSTSRPLHAVLSDSAGRFFLYARGAGRYFLRADRIGYATATTPALDVRAGPPLDYRFEIAARAVSLKELQVTGDERQCRRLSDGAASQSLWQEARKALEATAWTARNRAVRFTVMRYERELDAAGRSVVREDRSSREIIGANPFVALAKEELATQGFARVSEQETVFYAPDANVLLSDVFLDTHCFRVRAGDPGHVGLAFQPASGQRKPDVTGVLWLDRNSSELRTLTFQFTNLPGPQSSFPAGGEVHFERLSTGAWIVKSWKINGPLVGLRSNPALGGNPAISTQPEPVLVGQREEGGTVTAVVAANLASLYAATSLLTGTVIDSLTQRPLVDATVFLSGTEFTTRTNADGRFELRVPERTYDVAFWSPQLDSLGYAAPLKHIRVRSGETQDIELSVPSASTIMSALCPDREQPVQGGMIYGIVYGDDGKPAPYIQLQMEWIEFIPQMRRSVQSYRTVYSGPDGRYYMCFVPRDVPVKLRLNSPGWPARETELRLPDRPLLKKDFK